MSVNVKRLELQDVMSLFKTVLEKHMNIPRLGIRDFIELICRLVYRYEQWKNKIDMLLTIPEFNAFVNVLEQHNVEIVYTRYGDFLDCLTFRIDNEDLATVCEDPELERYEKRVTFLNLDKLSKYVKLTFRIVNYKGEHLSSYVNDVPTFSTFSSLPIYYVLHVSKLGLQDLLNGIYAGLILSKDQVNEDLVALGILMMYRDVSALAHAHYFASINDVQRISTLMYRSVLQEDDKRLTLSVNGKLLLSGVKVNGVMMKITYMNVLGFLQQGVEPWMVKLCVA